MCQFEIERITINLCCIGKLDVYSSEEKNKAVVKLSEKILPSVSGILLEYNCCKLEILVFNLIGKHMRRKELAG